MDPRDAAVATKAAVGALGGGFMISREVKALCERSGLGPREMYFRGRCGVLGEVDPGVVVAAAVFFPPGHVEQSWEGGRRLPVDEAVRLYASACHAWGERRLGAFDGADRLCALLTAVADGSDVLGAPLFAGWRALPRPASGPALTAHLLHLVRELRGARHATAVIAYGVDPLVATLAGDPAAGTPATHVRGADAARFLAWPEPYPEPTPDEVKRRGRAEELTDDLMAAAYTVLSPAGRAELVDLLTQALQAAAR
ncbi:hypothetical protein GCM10009530_01070 [Microbispora corallina]|uniref:EvbL n=1 Tax=Microbispora corallina TaxID=83302 RepID=A0ABQ4FS64_9ACTN|nr:hypothetical protein [Microbispora corallina]GIH37666.1 hypothetical protein Mco01_06660 [Microbispora corallina]